MPSPYPLNPLTLPLSGLQLIEASAGTGKTWTLAALYVRLVLERGLYPPQLLVMTFTEAATAELRERVRARLAQAARFFQTGIGGDDFLTQLRGQFPPEQYPHCAGQLDLAAQWMDEAAIFTLHGWCSRMLKSHAFASASLFTQTRVDDSDRLQLLAVQDYWRHWFYALEAQTLPALRALGHTPQDLLGKLKTLWRSSERAPQQASATLQPPDVLLAQWAQWQQKRALLEAPARLLWTPALTQTLRDLALAKTLKNYRANWLPGWLAQMDAWAQGEAIEPTVLARFTTRTLVASGWAQAAEHTVFGQLQALHEHLGSEPAVAAALLAHAAAEVLAAYQRAKAQAAQFDFSDLLQNLYHALQAPDGRLAAAIAAQYPVALVDEFQDTDPWQYGSLSKIYAGTGGAGGTETALIMIGDPKQAIYSFRGADLATYLVARAQAQGIYTLPGNYRSTTGVVAAVNKVFGAAAEPFGSVPYAPVQACNPRVQPLQVAGRPQVAMTVWHLPYDKAPTKPVFLHDMAALFATQMVALLNRSAARPGQMAVLVRDWTQAAAMRQALAERGLRSVYLSERSSVYASVQASDLWRMLRAVAQPGSNRLLRAALATTTWGLSWDELATLLADETAWERMVEQFTQWQQVWRAQGFLPLLHRMLHDQPLAQRLLQDAAQGERALTNLLHLGELLQAASTQLQGEGALLRYLEAQLRAPTASGDAAQLRLESDANLVQVVTLHKAKGLEYPLVFLPFVSLFKAEQKDSLRPDAERLSEDIRLLYVGLTRAQQALWLGAASTAGDLEGTPARAMNALSALLGRSAPGDLLARLQTWACDDIVVQSAPPPTPEVYQPGTPARPAQPALLPRRVLARGWWSASFSALTRDLAQDAPHLLVPGLPSERDEQLLDAQMDNLLRSTGALLADQATVPVDLLTTAPQFNDFAAGSRYGTLLHDLLEWQACHGWPLGQTAAVLDAEWTVLLARRSQQLALSSAQSALLLRWLQCIVATALPVPGEATPALTLAGMRRADHWPEMGFSLPVAQLPSQRLDALIARQVWPGQDRAALQPHQLEGMLTGFIDLVLLHQGRYYVLDYKSNRLPGYAPTQLQHAMLAHRYDVQAVLYLLALHRLLKSRLPDYDYDQHVGGALYLFLRGIDQPGAGLLTLRPPRALLEALDAAFAAAA